jgi:hypothetical protein
LDHKFDDDDDVTIGKMDRPHGQISASRERTASAGDIIDQRNVITGQRDLITRSLDDSMTR